MNTPNTKVWSTTGPSRPPIGLDPFTASRVACIDVGELSSRNELWAIFDSPAYRKVAPRNARSGNSTHSGLLNTGWSNGGRAKRESTGRLAVSAFSVAAFSDGGFCRTFDR